MNIEPLETRIAPALVIAANGLSATYDDIDGDRVTLKVNKGDLNTASFTFLNDQLDVLDLTGGDFDGANLTFTVKRVAGGDGLANIGLIDSTNQDLGKVSVKGDLAAIFAGDATTLNDPALLSLSARSLGRFSATGAANGNSTLESKIQGALGSLKLTGDLLGYLNVTGGTDGDIATISIGGSVVGGTTLYAGAISVSGSIGTLKIGHDVQGGAGAATGRIFAQTFDKITIHGSLIGGATEQSGDILGNDSIGKLKIGGSIIGGRGSNSGFVLAVNIGSIKIGLDVKGGSGISSGSINANESLGPVTVGGSLIGGSSSSSGIIFGVTAKTVKVAHNVIGGSGSFSGGIQANQDLTGVTVGGSVLGGSASTSGFISANDGNLGPVKIGRDLVGGSITGTDASIGDSGLIRGGGSIASVTIDGSIIAGADNSTVGSITRSATVVAGDAIGSITVKGGLIGTRSINGDTMATIAARGQDAASPDLTGTTDVAIGRISIGGRVENAQILAGYGVSLTPMNGNAQVGSVKVGGDWIASSLVAGVQDGGATGFGDVGDTIIGSGTIARIASIKIKGIVAGTSAPGPQFGFVSHTIGSFKAGGIVLPLTTTPLEVFSLSPGTGDVTVREI